MDPEKVVSPRKHLNSVKVIYKNESFSIALLNYDGVNRIGIRWNGGENEKGYPQSCGYPTWFLLPKAIALAYAEQSGDVAFKISVDQAKDDK